MPSHVIKCPSCGTANRIPDAREGVAGRCGNCGSALPVLHIHPVSLDDTTFDTFVQGYHGPVLAEFWAPW